VKQCARTISHFCLRLSYWTIHTSPQAWREILMHEACQRPSTLNSQDLANTRGLVGECNSFLELVEPSREIHTASLVCLFLAIRLHRLCKRRSRKIVGKVDCMKACRFWIEIVVVGTGVACLLALLIATLGVVAGTAAALERPGEQRSYEGMVTCSRCGARHSAKLGKTAAECTLVCVHGGAQFALVDGDKAYLLDGDAILLKKIVGLRARIVGSVTGNTIRVSSATAGS
jgi:hypothetical protein